MIQSRDNNALKFTPTPEAALSIIFGPAAKLTIKEFAYINCFVWVFHAAETRKHIS